MGGGAAAPVGGFPEACGGAGGDAAKASAVRGPGVFFFWELRGLRREGWFCVFCGVPEEEDQQEKYRKEDDRYAADAGERGTGTGVG